MTITIPQLALVLETLERIAHAYADECGLTQLTDDAAVAWCLDETEIHAGQLDAYRTLKAFVAEFQPWTNTRKTKPADSLKSTETRRPKRTLPLT